MGGGAQIFSKCQSLYGEELGIFPSLRNMKKYEGNMQKHEESMKEYEEQCEETDIFLHIFHILLHIFDIFLHISSYFLHIYYIKEFLNVMSSGGERGYTRES